MAKFDGLFHPNYMCRGLDYYFFLAGVWPSNFSSLGRLDKYISGGAYVPSV